MKSMIREENKLQALERKVEELERKLKEKENLKNDIIKEVEARLTGYQDVVRSDKGEVILKKNFVIKNRKGEIPGYEDDNDNAISLFFNDIKPGRLNHIFLGDDGIKGAFNNNCLAGRVVYKEDAPNIFNNGAVQMMLLREEDISANNRIKHGLVPHFSIHPSEVYNIAEKGEVVSIVGGREGGIAQVAHINQGVARAIWVTKDGIFIPSNLSEGGIYEGLPTSDPGRVGQLWNDGGTVKISSGT